MQLGAAMNFQCCSNQCNIQNKETDFLELEEEIIFLS